MSIASEVVLKAFYFASAPGEAKILEFYRTGWRCNLERSYAEAIQISCTATTAWLTLVAIGACRAFLRHCTENLPKGQK